jgi:hypothetical protein
VTVLQFDEATHTYTLGGVVLPSVTQVLQVLPNGYHMVDPDVLERAAKLGTAVHDIIARDIAGDLDEEAVEFELLPYLDMWRHFRGTSGFEPILSEERVYSEQYGYAGTLDLFGRLKGRHVLIDNKRTAAVPRSTGPQTAGYDGALRERFPEFAKLKIDRFALHLTPSRWQLVPLKDSGDWRVFLSALNIHKWSNAK